MGYSHHWRRAPELDREGFAKAAQEAKIIIERATELGIRLAGPTGDGVPDVTEHTIAFNGNKNCGHRYRDLGKPWPSSTAEGVEATNDPVSGGEPFGTGAYLETRVCGGNCAGEAFVIDRKYLARGWDRMEHGGYFCNCETSYKPYDLVVTAVLIRLKENLPDQIKITSDSEERGFEDAKRLCRELFGWPSHFGLEDAIPDLQLN